MERQKPASAEAMSKASNDLTRVWTVAAYVASQAKRGSLSSAMRTATAPFMNAAVELALAILSNPEEDAAAILQRACVALEAATQMLPSLVEYRNAPLSAEQAERWQRALVRRAQTISRDFPLEPDQPPTVPAADLGYEPYSTTPAAELEEPDPSRLWLIEQLWQRSGTGIVGGSAKGAKTWLCLDLALSVASGTPALDKFAVHRPGGVLFVSAEGGQAYLKERLNALCAHRGLSLGGLPHRLDIIPTAIRIDTPDGIGRLDATIKELRPTLLVLDPLVRLHRIDENSASSVSGLLSSLSELHRAYDVAILVAHHSSKHGSRSGEMSGQAFRGSSDLYAWGDSNIFLGKKGNKFVLAAEHRAAPATARWTMAATTDDCPRLQLVNDDASEASADQHGATSNEKMDAEILAILQGGPRSLDEVRKAVRGSNARISAAINRLQTAKKIAKAGRLWTLANGHAAQPDTV